MNRTALLNQIAIRWRPVALAVATRWARGGEFAEDVVQDAFVRLMERRWLPTEPGHQRALVMDYLRWSWITVQQQRTAQKRDVRQTSSLQALAASHPDPDEQDAEMEIELPALRSVLDEVLMNEMMDLVGDGVGDLTAEEKAGLAKRMENDAGPTPKVVQDARAKLADRLNGGGYERHQSGLAPYPRNRSVYMQEYRRRRATEVSE